MSIHGLRLLHQEKTPGSALVTPVVPDSLVLDTCQRTLLLSASPDGTRSADGWQSYHGHAAYRFLLEVACGLHSSIPGETHVFGQLKRAWERFTHDASRDAYRRLRPFMQMLFADTKWVRSNHLRGTGCSSYGVLTRKLLAPHTQDRVCIVGNGALAGSVLPALRAQPLALWSRRPPDIALPPGTGLFRPGNEVEAVSWADHLVLCTPVVSSLDERWSQVAREASLKTILHLGTLGRPAMWFGERRFRNLQDLFDLRRAQRERRTAQLETAFAAASERARRRFSLEQARSRKVASRRLSLEAVA